MVVIGISEFRDWSDSSPRDAKSPPGDEFGKDVTLNELSRLRCIEECAEVSLWGGSGERVFFAEG